MPSRMAQCQQTRASLVSYPSTYLFSRAVTPTAGMTFVSGHRIRTAAPPTFAQRRHTYHLSIAPPGDSTPVPADLSPSGLLAFAEAWVAERQRLNADVSFYNFLYDTLHREAMYDLAEPVLRYAAHFPAFPTHVYNGFNVDAAPELCVWSAQPLAPPLLVGDKTIFTQTPDADASAFVKPDDDDAEFDYWYVDNTTGALSTKLGPPLFENVGPVHRLFVQYRQSALKQRLVLVITKTFDLNAYIATDNKATALGWPLKDSSHSAGGVSTNSHELVTWSGSEATVWACDTRSNEIVPRADARITAELPIVDAVMFNTGEFNKLTVIFGHTHSVSMYSCSIGQKPVLKQNIPLGAAFRAFAWNESKFAVSTEAPIAPGSALPAMRRANPTELCRIARTYARRDYVQPLQNKFAQRRAGPASSAAMKTLDLLRAKGLLGAYDVTAIDANNDGIVWGNRMGELWLQRTTTPFNSKRKLGQLIGSVAGVTIDYTNSTFSCLSINGTNDCALYLHTYNHKYDNHTRTLPFKVFSGNDPITAIARTESMVYVGCGNAVFFANATEIFPSSGSGATVEWQRVATLPHTSRPIQLAGSPKKVAVLYADGNLWAREFGSELFTKQERQNPDINIFIDTDNIIKPFSKDDVLCESYYATGKPGGLVVYRKEGSKQSYHQNDKWADMLETKQNLMLTDLFERRFKILLEESSVPLPTRLPSYNAVHHFFRALYDDPSPIWAFLFDPEYNKFHIFTEPLKRLKSFYDTLTPPQKEYFKRYLNDNSAQINLNPKDALNAVIQEYTALLSTSSVAAEHEQLTSATVIINDKLYAFNRRSSTTKMTQVRTNAADFLVAAITAGAFVLIDDGNLILYQNGAQKSSEADISSYCDTIDETLISATVGSTENDAMVLLCNKTKPNFAVYTISNYTTEEASIKPEYDAYGYDLMSEIERIVAFREFRSKLYVVCKMKDRRFNLILLSATSVSVASGVPPDEVWVTLIVVDDILHAVCKQSIYQVIPGNSSPVFTSEPDWALSAATDALIVLHKLTNTNGPRWKIGETSKIVKGVASSFLYPDTPAEVGPPAAESTSVALSNTTEDSVVYILKTKVSGITDDLTCWYKTKNRVSLELGYRAIKLKSEEAILQFDDFNYVYLRQHIMYSRFVKISLELALEARSKALKALNAVVNDPSNETFEEVYVMPFLNIAKSKFDINAHRNAIDDAETQGRFFFRAYMIANIQTDFPKTSITGLLEEYKKVLDKIELYAHDDFFNLSKDAWIQDLITAVYTTFPTKFGISADKLILPNASVVVAESALFMAFDAMHGCNVSAATLSQKDLETLKNCILSFCNELNNDVSGSDSYMSSVTSVFSAVGHITAKRLRWALSQTPPQTWEKAKAEITLLTPVFEYFNFLSDYRGPPDCVDVLKANVAPVAPLLLERPVEQIFRACPPHPARLPSFFEPRGGVDNVVTDRHGAVWTARPGFTAAELHDVMRYPNCLDAATSRAVSDGAWGYPNGSSAAARYDLIKPRQSPLADGLGRSPPALFMNRIKENVGPNPIAHRLIDDAGAMILWLSECGRDLLADFASSVVGLDPAECVRRCAFAEQRFALTDEPATGEQMHRNASAILMHCGVDVDAYWTHSRLFLLNQLPVDHRSHYRDLVSFWIAHWALMIEPTLEISETTASSTRTLRYAPDGTVRRVLYYKGTMVCLAPEDEPLFGLLSEASQTELKLEGYYRYARLSSGQSVTFRPETKDIAANLFSRVGGSVSETVDAAQVMIGLGDLTLSAMTVVNPDAQKTVPKLTSPESAVYFGPALDSRVPFVVNKKRVDLEFDTFAELRAIDLSALSSWKSATDAERALFPKQRFPYIAWAIARNLGSDADLDRLAVHKQNEVLAQIEALLEQVSVRSDSSGEREPTRRKHVLKLLGPSKNVLDAQAPLKFGRDRVLPNVSNEDETRVRENDSLPDDLREFFTMLGAPKLTYLLYKIKTRDTSPPIVVDLYYTLRAKFGDEPTDERKDAFYTDPLTRSLYAFAKDGTVPTDGVD